MRVFLSSTHLDLIEHRQAATNALERLGQQVGRMEIFGARPAGVLSACVGEIDECDLFVGVYAHRYGHIPPRSRYSITEQEFRHARERKKPLFCYFVDDTYDWPPELVEGGPAHSKLLRFKRVVTKSVVPDFFGEPLDLAVKIVTAIGLHLIRNQTLLAVAARDEQEMKRRLALIAVLEARKHEILMELGKDDAVRKKFLRLHARNVAAIRKGELLLSHLLTVEIQALIYPAMQARTVRESRGEQSHVIGFPAVAASSARLDFTFAWPDSTFNVTPWYPNDMPLYSSDAEWILPPDWPLHAAVSDDEHLWSKEWRSRLLEGWLELEVTDLYAKLAKQRYTAELQRSGAARGVVKAGVRRNRSVSCTYCGSQLKIYGRVGETTKCPSCLTHLELIEYTEFLEQATPKEYEGHLIVGDSCKTCGATLGAIRSFKFKCL